MRRPKYLEPEPGRQDRWLISYVDIITVLLILFVAAAAHGVPVHASAAAPVVQPRPAAQHAPISQSLIAAKRKLEERGVDVEVRERALIVSIRQAVLFASGEDRISPSALPTISGIAQVLEELPTNKVILVGHADATPIHSVRFQSNWELSAARSLRLLEVLTAQYGIAEERLSISSQGSQNPKGSNDTEDGRAANRRVELIIQSD